MFRQFYYTDWGDDAKVVRCQLDGSACIVLLRGLQNPNSLVVNDSVLYVVDSQLKHPSDPRSSTLIKLTTTSASDMHWTTSHLSHIDVFHFVFLLRSNSETYLPLLCSVKAL